jgi:MFS family permease
MPAQSNNASAGALPRSEALAEVENANFRHLVWDVLWFGLAAAATTRFLSVFAIRLGASPIDLGWIAALPSLILLFSSPLGSRWTRRFSDPRRALMLPTFLWRLTFLLPAFAPSFPAELRPLWLILAVTLPALAQGASAIAFTVMFREAVTPEKMNLLLSRRGIWFNAGLAVGALVLGFWLERAPFPFGYQVMFAAAFLFAMISQWHCSRVRILSHTPAPPPSRESNPWISPNFRRVAVVTAVIHIAYCSITSVIPLFLVQEMGAAEGFIALHGLVELGAGALIGTQTPRIVARIGNRGMIAVSMLFLMIAAVTTAFAPNLYFTLIGAALTGAAWTAAAVIGLFAFYSENTPPQYMTSYSAAYHQVIGVSAFIGPMIGSVLADHGIDLVTVLLVGAVLRLIAAPMVDPSLFAPRPAEREDPLPAGLSLKM